MLLELLMVGTNVRFLGTETTFEWDSLLSITLNEIDLRDETPADVPLITDTSGRDPEIDLLRDIDETGYDKTVAGVCIMAGVCRRSPNEANDGRAGFSTATPTRLIGNWLPFELLRGRGLVPVSELFLIREKGVDT